MTPKADKVKTVQAGPKEREGRLSKAQQFLKVAQDVEELNTPDGLDGVRDACVTLLVHAGIAASDAICAKALGKHAQGENHAAAVTLLASVDKEAGTSLNTLLGMKTRAGYGHDPVSSDQLKKAKRAAEALVERASF